MSMQDAVARHVRDVVVIEGFTHLISFAAGHEIIRQRRRDLTLCRLTPDLIYDQMIAAGCAKKLVFSWAGNPRIKSVTCPYTGEALATVPALNPDVTIVHAQRADAQGNTQIWGLLGVQKEAAFASQRVIVVVEELVEERVIRSDPNRTLIPATIVDAVVVEPWGAHPSYAQGYYDRDNDFYVGWEAISRDRTELAHYLDEFVYGVPGRAEYMQKQPRLKERLKAAEQYSAGVNYGF